jgi:hypothetical protein
MRPFSTSALSQSTIAVSFLDSSPARTAGGWAASCAKTGSTGVKAKAASMTDRSASWRMGIAPPGSGPRSGAGSFDRN